MSKEDRAADIKIICEKCGCDERKRKLHYQMFVYEGYQPHASLRFKNWWFSQQEFKDSGVGPVVAQNVARIWDAYLEAKQIGVA